MLTQSFPHSSEGLLGLSYLAVFLMLRLQKTCTVKLGRLVMFVLWFIQFQKKSSQNTVSFVCLGVGVDIIVCKLKDFVCLI